MLKVICKPSVCAWHAARCSFLLLDLKRSEIVPHILNAPSQAIIPKEKGNYMCQKLFNDNAIEKDTSC